jgi:hypothetical protein
MGSEYQVLLVAPEQAAHHRLDLGARELDPDVRGHGGVSSPAG